MRLSWIGAALVALLVPGVVACTASGNQPSSGAGGTQAAGGGGSGATSANGTGGEDLITVGSSTTGTTTTGAGGSGGTPSCTGAGGGPGSTDEVCGNGKDENGNGFIDEGCSCDVGTTQMCYPGKGDLCECKVGTQTCIQTGEFGQWGPCEGAAQACVNKLDDSCEVCGNGKDDDCDGAIDEGCVIDLDVDIDGDCVSASCPPQAPYPIGCNIVMSGNDTRGCVANTPGDSSVYFQEGDNCGAGHVTGTLKCSSVQGPPLDAMNCPINKSKKYYPANKSGCP